MAGTEHPTQQRAPEGYQRAAKQGYIMSSTSATARNKAVFLKLVLGFFFFFFWWSKAGERRTQTNFRFYILCSKRKRSI